MHIDFNASERSSLGVEVELELVDAQTRDLRSAASEILLELNHPKAKHELLESTVEIITGVCASVDEARRDLESTLAEVTGAAERRGLAVLCSGTHPFADWAEQQISPDPRYAKLIDEMQWPARRLQIFGIHVHVGVRSSEKAIAIANALGAYIPHLLALSASSPYWMGKDTGLASSRSKVFESLPTAGLPYQLSGWDEFEEYMEQMIATKAISSIREVWWDIRPHPNFGTVELRMFDGMPTMSEIASAAAVAQCLVEWLDSLVDRGYTLPTPRSWIVRENKWRAARHGTDAEIVVDDTGALRPVEVAVSELVEELSPVARRLKCEDELRHALRIVQTGPSYQRQRRVVEAGGELTDVVDQLVNELKTDLPGG